MAELGLPIEQSPDAQIRSLMEKAYEVRHNAYCPYSNFHVGASVLCEDGTIYTGTNVENACYGLTVCAERIAIMTAVSQNHRKFKAMAICCDIKETFKASCGACRQVMAEFGLDFDLYLVKPNKTWMKINLKELMPMPFLPEHLLNDNKPI